MTCKIGTSNDINKHVEHFCITKERERVAESKNKGIRDKEERKKEGKGKGRQGKG